MYLNWVVRRWYECNEESWNFSVWRVDAVCCKLARHSYGSVISPVDSCLGHMVQVPLRLCRVQAIIIGLICPPDSVSVLFGGSGDSLLSGGSTSSLKWDQGTMYSVSQKKQDTKLLPITSPNVNRFSRFFHWQTHW